LCLGTSGLAPAAVGASAWDIRGVNERASCSLNYLPLSFRPNRKDSGRGRAVGSLSETEGGGGWHHEDSGP